MTLPQAFTCQPDNNSTANFRAWASAISTALQAGGNLVKTADTGQINLATVVPGTAGTSAGYEMYRFNDSLQATAPVFIKIEYGTSGGGNGWPQIWATVGTATDGAGTLTSIANTGVSVSTRQTISNSPSSLESSARQCYVNGDASTLVMALWNSAVNSAACILVVERTRDTTGAPTGDAVLVVWANSITGTAIQTVLMHNQVAQPGLSTTAVASVYPQPALSSGIKDGVMSVYPLMTGGSPKLGAPSKFVVMHNPADLAAAGTFANTHYGVSHNWVSWSGPRASNWGAFAIRTD